ncbi:MAG: ADP-ribosylation factor-like protein [Candidatus Heimdallarchaeaceae archaeon]
MQKEELLEILDEHLFGNSYLNEEKLAKKINLSSNQVKDYFLQQNDRTGFLKEGKSVFFAHELIRSCLDKIHDSFWKWYLYTVPSHSELAWEEGAGALDISRIPIIPQARPKEGIIQSFSARIILLGEERVGKQSFVYALSGETPNQPAPGVFFGKIVRASETFNIDFESVILDIPPGSPHWLYAKACFGVILVYDVTNPSTFEKIQSWLDTFLDVYSYDLCPPIMILGNKIDLQNEDELTSLAKEVELFRQSLEKEYGTIVLSEFISCTESRNVLAAFENFANTVRQWYQIIKTEYSDEMK